MSIPRRKFFKIGAFSILASLALGSRNFAETVAKSSGDFSLTDTTDRLLALRAGDFRNQIGSDFNFWDGSRLRRAILTEVKKSETSVISEKSNSGSEFDSSDFNNFSMTFRLSKALPAAQTTYHVSHSILGAFELFAVPGKVSEREFLLIAVINRI